MAGEIKITPELLNNQAILLSSLQEEYESLFSSVSSDLNRMNGNWSSLLANNFSGKINSAQKSFSNVVSMLEAGAKAATESANTMQSVDQALAKMSLGDGNVGVKKKSSGASSPTGVVTKKKSSSKKKGLFDDICKSVGPAVKKAKKKVKSVIKDAVKEVKDKVEELRKSYDEKGAVYEVVQGISIGLKVVKGVGKMAAGIAGLVAAVPSGGLTGPVAVLSIISGANDIFNGLTDAALIHEGMYNEVGKHNFMKDTLASNAGDFTEAAFGNREVGENIGKGVYYSVDFVTSMAELDAALNIAGKAAAVTEKVGGTGAKVASGVSSVLAKGSGKVAVKATGAAVSAAGKVPTMAKAVVGVIDKTIDFGEKTWDLLTLGDESKALGEEVGIVKEIVKSVDKHVILN